MHSKIFSFIFFLAISLIIELAIWIFVGGGATGPDGAPYPYVYDTVSWIVKNFALGFGLNFLYWKWESGWKHIDKIKTTLLYLFIGNLYFFLASIGHEGGPVCGAICSDFEGLAIIFHLPIWLFIIALLFSRLVFPKLNLVIQNKSFRKTATVFSILIISAFSFHTIYIKNLVAQLNNNDLRTSFRNPDGLRTKHPNFSEADWLKICSNYRVSSLGLRVLGSDYANWCYYFTAISFNKAQYCQHVLGNNFRSSLRWNCDQHFKELETVLIVNGVPKFESDWDVYRHGDAPYSPHVTIVNKTNGVIDTTGFSVWFNDLEVAKLNSVSIGPRQRVTIPINITLSEMVSIIQRSKKEPIPNSSSEYSFKLLNVDNTVISRKNHILVNLILPE
jgi:hypothetical protein